ncbi:hypothetical protein F5Y10DRAFT_71095 [Nemania abortiva]|nr:hypothetical protein F5Y10DRAFT_71095 [Nemania abortiva]
MAALADLCDKAFNQLWTRWKDPEAFDLDDSDLEKLSIYRGRMLDLVEPDSMPDSFFEPYPDDPELGGRVGTQHVIGLKEHWPSCLEDHHRVDCAQRLAGWFLSMFSLAFLDEPVENELDWADSSFLCEDRKHQMPWYRGWDLHPEVFKGSQYEDTPQFCANFVFRSEAQPHVGCILTDTRVPTEGRILRSEVIMALTLLRHETFHQKIPGQTNVPVIIYTVGHSEAARVTQFHVDNGKLVYRQSELLYLGSKNIDEVVIDAIDLLRWMKCKPINNKALC